MDYQISAVVATYNEEKNITGCIKSLKKFADEIVIVDGSSQDRTREYAKREGARVVKVKNREMFHINKNIAIKNAKNPWIFLIDADERVSDLLAEEVKKTVKNNPPENGFWINRRNWFLGGFLTKGGAYPDSVIRLFRNGKGKLPERSVHEQVEIQGQVGKLNNDILHFADPSFSRYLKRVNRYTDLSAKEIALKSPPRNLIYLMYYTLVKTTRTFIKIYFRNKGFKDGFRGFAWALFSSIHHFISYVKYWEQKKYESHA